ncbi:translation initiation factor IF-2-like [Cervus elaphus]|uniref:translation initiation factor IF-2-like n=1 Tax=Cervus elaphus TaxID=9860 RepID=UPI001CC32A1D|nr:translation initiation factor IF-2-like [Cervus elaphus]
MMLPLTRLWPLLRWGTAAAAAAEGAAAGGSPTTTTTEEEEEEDDDEDEDEDDEDGGERPALPAEAPGSPAPSAAEARGFFRGGGEAPPVSESEEEEAEARVSSPREAVGEEEGEEEGEKEDPGPFPPPPPGGSSGCAARGSGRGGRRGAAAGGSGPAAGLSPGGGGGGGGGGRQRRQLPPLSSGPLRSAPWCVDSSPSCCLMESRRSRHRKCLYCPPHSLPVAGGSHSEPLQIVDFFTMNIEGPQDKSMHDLHSPTRD